MYSVKRLLVRTYTLRDGSVTLVDSFIIVLDFFFLGTLDFKGGSRVRKRE